jgi:hypothetical protein
MDEMCDFWNELGKIFRAKGDERKFAKRETNTRSTVKDKYINK